MNGSNNQGILDALAIFSVCLQIATVQASAVQATNDDILKELQMQDHKYFEQILENQKLILDKLAKLG